MFMQLFLLDNKIKVMVQTIGMWSFRSAAAKSTVIIEKNIF